MRVSAVIVKWSYSFANICQTFVVWLTVSVGLFRYVAVCMPLYGQQYCRLDSAQRIVVAVLLCSLAFNVSRFWDLTYGYDSCMQVSEMQEVVYVMASEFRMNAVFSKVYMALYNVLIFVAPFSVLLFVNFRAIAAVRRSYKLRTRQISKTQSKQALATKSLLSRGQTTTTLMLICIVFIFLACNLPTFVANIVEIIIGSERSKDESRFIRFVDISNLLVVLNSSANIIIYISLSKQYRKLLLFVAFRRGPPPKGWQALGYLPVPLSQRNNNQGVALLTLGSLHQSKKEKSESSNSD